MKTRNLIIAGGVAAAVAIGGCATLADGGDDTPGHRTVPEAAQQSATAPETPSGPATSFQDGTFLVGTDIAAGTYKTTGEADLDLGCYWERSKDDTGDFDSIIANDYSDGPGRVTVKAGEIFKTSGGCDWKLAT